MSDEITKEIPSSGIPEEKQKRTKASTRRRAKIHRLLAGIVIAVLTSALAAAKLPVLRIAGGGMAPTLADGNYVVAAPVTTVAAGDIVAFYCNDKILVKRVIGCPGDRIRIDDEGTVYVNGLVSDESYISEKGLGDADIEFPYEVPEGRYFVLGDRRSVSTDSRMTAVGCVAQEQIIGIVVFRVWPFADFGFVA